MSILAKYLEKETENWIKSYLSTKFYHVPADLVLGKSVILYDSSGMYRKYHHIIEITQVIRWMCRVVVYVNNPETTALTC